MASPSSLAICINWHIMSISILICLTWKYISPPAAVQEGEAEQEMWQLSHSPRSPATELKPIMRHWNPNKALDGNDSHVWLQRVVYARVPELPRLHQDVGTAEPDSNYGQLIGQIHRDRFLLLSSTSQVKSNRAKEQVPIFNEFQNYLPTRTTRMSAQLNQTAIMDKSSMY